MQGSLSPSILILQGKETATTTKIPSYSDWQQMARPTSEAHQCLIGHQNPHRFHCPHCRTTLSPHPTISLSKFQTLSSMPYKTVRIDLKKQDLGVFILQQGRMRASWNAKLAASLYFSRITPPLLRLVGAENHNSTHRTMHGISR